MPDAIQVAATRIRIFDTNPARTNSADLVEGFKQLLDIDGSVVARGGSPFNEFALGFLLKVGSPKAILPPADPISAVEQNDAPPNVVMSGVATYFEGVRRMHPGSPLIILTIEREKSVIYLTARPDETDGIVSIIMAQGANYHLLNNMSVPIHT